MNMDGIETESLASLDAIDAFKLAIEQSHKPLPQIAQEMGWSESFTKRIFSPERYYPSVVDLPKFCIIVKNTVILQWLQAKTLTYGMPHVCQDVDCAMLIGRIGKLFAEVGDVGRKGQEAVADGVLEAHELRGLINEVKDVLTEGMELVGDLRVMERDLATKEGKQNV